MKKIISLIIIVLMLMMIRTEVVAIHTSSHIATRTAIHSATTGAMIASSRRRHRNSYTIEKATEEIFNETKNEELKNYILENKQYLYLNNKEKTEAVINKYKESNLEETKQFIKDNYYDENKPKNDEMWGIFAIGIIIIIFILGIIAVFTT